MSKIFCSTCTNFLYPPVVTMATNIATSEAMIEENRTVFTIRTITPTDMTITF